MKAERRSSFINRSFRKSFRKKKPEDDKTPEEIEVHKKNMLAELKKAVEDITEPHHNDRVFIDVLKGRDYDLKESVTQFRSNVNLLKFLIPGNSYIIPQVVNEHGLGGVLGFDKEGHVVRLINFGLIDFKGFIHSLNTLELFRSIVHFVQKDLDAMEERNKKTGQNTCQILFIIDMEGFSPSQFLYKPVHETVLAALKYQRDLFYDIIKDILIFNVPSCFQAIYKLLKPAINENFNKRIKVLGDNWRDVLLEVIDADVLPESLGGSRVDGKGDPRCSEIISYSGEIPKSFYPQDEDFLCVDDPGVKEIVIPAGSSVNIPIAVKKLKVRLDVCIMSVEHDLAIAIFYDPDLSLCDKKLEDKDLSKFEQIAPVVRTQCNLKPISTHFTPWKTGTFVFQFNNCYSWMAPKTVLYKIISSNA